MAEAYVGLGDVYAVAEKPDFEKAMALYQQARDIDPASPDPAIGDGNILLGEGKFRPAIEQYKVAIAAAVQRNTPSYGAHAGLGSAWFALGEYRKAIDEFNRAIGANPASVIARFRLASAVYLNDRNDPAAVALFQGLLGSKLKRVDSLARTNLAFMLLEKTPAGSEGSVLPEAIKYLEEAYQRDRYAFSALRLGIGRALQGDTNQAAKLWDECSELSWGSDATERRLYSSFLSALRGEPNGSEALGQSIGSLEREGAAGLLDGLHRDVDLIHRAKNYDTQVVPILEKLDVAIRNARASSAADSH
jgi:tetratricopeptide (TPR) repeat protein